MHHVKVARSVLLTTRDAVLGLIVFTIIAVSILAKSGTGNTFILNDFLALSTTGNFLTLTQQNVATPIAPASQKQFQDAVRMVETAVPVASQRTDAMFQRTSKTTAVFLLAFIFTAVVAFMLTFLRHLQKVYVVPSIIRRESWA